jgi:hypothetical protein
MLGQRKISLTIVLPGVANSDFREVLSKRNLSGSLTQVLVLSLTYLFLPYGPYIKAFEGSPFAWASASSIGADCFALIVCLKLQQVGKRKDLSKAARKILEKVNNSSHVRHRFLAHMAPFGEGIALQLILRNLRQMLRVEVWNACLIPELIS